MACGNSAITALILSHVISKTVADDGLRRWREREEKEKGKEGTLPLFRCTSKIVKPRPRLLCGFVSGRWAIETRPRSSGEDRWDSSNTKISQQD